MSDKQERYNLNFSNKWTVLKVFFILRLNIHIIYSMEQFAEAAKQYTYQSTQRVCSIPTVQECVFNTQGSIHCKGYATEGAEKKEEWTPKLTVSQNDRLFQRIVDERFTWR